MKPTATFILKITRKKENGKFPLIIRVIYLRVKHEYRTGLEFTEEEYANICVPKPSKQYRDSSAGIIAEKEKVNNILENLKVFTFKKFEDAYYGRIKEASNAYDIFDDYIGTIKNEGRLTTAMSYTNAMKSFQDFRPKLSMYDIDPTFLKKYQENRIAYGTSITTIGIYIRTLRAVYNYAVSKGIIKKDENYPFTKGKYTIPAGRNIKKALPISDITKIYNHETIPGTFIDRAKDFWLLSYLCNGMNFKDIAHLKVENIDDDMLRFVREKTKLSGQGNKKIISIYLSDKAKAIIQKWGTKSKNKNEFLFEIITNSDTPEEQISKIKQFIKNTNHNIKTICDSVGIEKKVTTYVARHSSATVLKKSGKSIAQIQEALGHSTQAVTQSYLDSFDDESKKDLANALNNF